MNASIADMVHGAGPFPGAREAIVAMQDEIDTIVVSATPLHALEYEWHAHGLAQYMKVIAGQEMGSKAEHVEYAAKGKYDQDKIMLIGDAPATGTPPPRPNASTTRSCRATRNTRGPGSPTKRWANSSPARSPASTSRR